MMAPRQFFFPIFLFPRGRILLFQLQIPDEAGANVTSAVFCGGGGGGGGGEALFSLLALVPGV